MTPEDRLTQVLHDEAALVDSDTAWTDVERGLSARRRSRWVRQVTLSGVAAAALVAGVLAVVSSEGDESSVKVVPADVPTATTPTTTAPTDESPNSPELAIASKSDGAVVMIAIDTSQVRRVLAPAPKPGQEFGNEDVSITADGKTAVYTYGVSTVDRSERLIYEVSLPDGEPRMIGAGTHPAISPDGQRLAYLTTKEMHNAAQPGVQQIVVRNLATGTESNWTLDDAAPGETPTVFETISWSPDSTRLVYSAGWEGTDTIAILNPDTDRKLADAAPVPMPGTVSYLNPLFRDNDHLVVEAARLLDGGDIRESAIVVIDPRTGREVERLVEGLHAMPLAFDSTGHSMLYVTATGAGQTLVPTLHQWSGPGLTAAVAEGYVSADW